MEKNRQSFSQCLGNSFRQTVAGILAFFQAERAAGVALLVRVHEPRKLEVLASGEVAKLAEMRGKLSAVGEKRVVITRQNKEITLVLAAEIDSFDSQGKSIFDPLHYTLKSGALEVEKLQFDDLTTTLNALAFYSVVAWQILAIVYLTRHAQDEVATKCFTAQEITMLTTPSKKT